MVGIPEAQKTSRAPQESHQEADSYAPRNAFVRAPQGDGLGNACVRTGEGGRSCKFEELREASYDFCRSSEKRVGRGSTGGS